MRYLPSSWLLLLNIKKLKRTIYITILDEIVYDSYFTPYTMYTVYVFTCTALLTL